MNELNLCVGIEDVDELIESYFDPLSNDGLIDILEAKDYDC
jgi:hypothetical protein